MARQVRTKHQREVNRTDMVAMMRRGATQGEIAEQFGVCRQQISADWKNVVADLHEARREDTEYLLTKKLMELAEVKGEAWQQWDAGKQPTTDAEGNERPGKPDDKWLRIVLQCIESECDLEGVAMPKQKLLDPTDVKFDPAKYLEFALPQLKIALEMIAQKRRQEQLPSVGGTVVQAPEAVPLEDQSGSAPPAVEFNLEEWLKARENGSQPSA